MIVCEYIQDSKGASVPKQVDPVFIPVGPRRVTAQFLERKTQYSELTWILTHVEREAGPSSILPDFRILLL